jgi:hypothetical protein
VKDYLQMGAVPTRQATANSHSAAAKLCNHFLGTMGKDPLPDGSLDKGKKGFIGEKEMCQTSMFRKLATYLLTERKEDGSWKYSYGVAKNRFGEVRGLVERIYGTGCVNKNDKDGTAVKGTKYNQNGSDAWFLMLKSKLDKEMMYRCAQSGSICAR